MIFKKQVEDGGQTPNSWLNGDLNGYTPSGTISNVTSTKPDLQLYGHLFVGTK